MKKTGFSCGFPHILNDRNDFMMRRTNLIKLLFFLILVSVSGITYSQGFKHPGLLLTNEDFVRIKAQLAAGNPDVVAGYNNLKSNEWSQSNVGTSPAEVVKRGTDDDNYVNAGRGAHGAYLNALRWKISGDVAHAERAIYILNSWASVTKEVTGNSNQSLASGLYGYEFAHAAELMRDYKGWKPEDFEKFKVWMRQVWYPKCYDFLIRRHGTWKQLGAPGHYWSNWGLCNTLAIMSIGVLCDDPFMYNQGVAFYKYDKIGTFNNEVTVNPTVSHVESWGFNEFLGNLVPVVYDDERGPLGKLGQMQESGRDQAHSMMALGLAVDICQVAWNQGDDLFAYMDNRLLAGIAWVAAYNTGTDDLPWTDYWYHAAANETWKQTAPSATERGQFRPIWDRIIGYYEGIKGISLNFSHQMADKVVADAGISSSHSSTLDHLGFTTLTCTRPKITADKAPLTLSTSIEYDGKTLQQGELNNVTPGSVVKLIPALPDSVSDTGNWKWNTGNTTKELEINADSSAIYRVTYTNEKGIESRQMFSISVYGDCLPDIYSYSVTTSNGVSEDSVVTVKQNSKVIMSVSSSNWHSASLWNTGETSGTKEAFVERADTVFSMTGTNLGGAAVTFNFHINVEPLSTSYKVGDGNVIYNDKAKVVAGQTVTLMPIVKSGMEGGTWLWSGGESTQNLTLENIQEEKEISVTYSLDGKEYSQTFSIVIIPDENSFAYWPMDESAGAIVHDVWAGNDGDVNLGGWTRTGAKNGGVKFDGGDSSFLKLSNDFTETLNDFTISVWVKPDALDTWARVWDFGTNTNYNMFLTDKASDGYVRFAIKAGGDEQRINTTKTLAINKWTHIAVTKSGNTAKMYINGSLVGSNTAMTLNPSDLGYTEQNYVGKSQWPDPMFKGTIDELQIYNRALSQTEIVKQVQDVEPFESSFSLDGGAVVKDSIVPVLAGQSVELMPVLKPGMTMITGLENTTWLWNNGETTQNLTLENLQDEQKISVNYTHAETVYALTFSIILKPDENALAYWPMDESDGTIAHDIWSGNNGNINSCVWTGSGKKNGGLTFDGAASSYVSLSSNFLSTLNDFTISVWVKPDQLDQWARILDFGINTDYNMFLTTKSGDGYVRFAIKAGGSEQRITTTKTLSTSKWTHIAVTKSGNTAKMYIDGGLVGSNNAMTLNPSDLGNTTHNYLGKSQWPDPMFKGVIDELRIYKKAMTPEEINALISTPTRVDETLAHGKDPLFYPNPANSAVHVINSEGSLLTLYDVNGNLILGRKIISDNQNIDISGMKSGIYILKIADNFKTSVQKLVVE
ncbi:MAG TPA: LamG-like jellyroll fold domain-containing protein [Sunxiuqinia sp.]|nr:LamG-like jellyroll fold domain-containing protein [Sunxiuqinia sp.]